MPASRKSPAGDSGFAYPTKKIEWMGFSMILRAKTFESVFGIIMPLERTYTRPPRTGVSRTVSSFRM